MTRNSSIVISASYFPPQIFNLNAFSPTKMAPVLRYFGLSFGFICTPRLGSYLLSRQSATVDFRFRNLNRGNWYVDLKPQVGLEVHGKMGISLCPRSCPRCWLQVYNVRMPERLVIYTAIAPSTLEDLRCVTSHIYSVDLSLLDLEYVCSYFFCWFESALW